MSEAARQLNNLPLSELIGGPLAAMVEAEALAAQTTVEYIEQIGFVPREPGAPESPAGEPGEDAVLGRLRMARFGYTKLDAEGRPAQFDVDVPVLSLVPIPGIRIKSGKFAFTARIVDIDPPEDADDTQEPGAGTRPPRLVLRKFARLRGGISPRSAPKETTAGAARGSFEIDIQIEVEQMPIAPGLDKLLTTFDQAILDARTPTPNE